MLDVTYDYAAIGAAWSKDDLAADRRRHHVALPAAAAGRPQHAAVPPLTVGGTPTYDAPRLAAALGIAQVWVKDEGRQPTASLKDRASAMAVVKAQEFGAAVVTTASTGNAAAALAGVCASVGQTERHLRPEDRPRSEDRPAARLRIDGRAGRRQLRRRIRPVHRRPSPGTAGTTATPASTPT